MRITRTDLTASGVSIPNLTKVFLAGLIASLCLVAAGIIFAFVTTAFPWATAALILPYIAVYNLTPANLALHALPVKEWVIALFALAGCGVAIATRNFAPEAFGLITGTAIFTYGALVLYAFFRAITDSEFRNRAETVQAILNNFDSEQANDMLAEAHDNQIFLGGFRAALRDAPDRKDAIVLTLQKIRTRTAEGASAARNQLDALAACFEKSYTQ